MSRREAEVRDVQKMFAEVAPTAAARWNWDRAQNVTLPNHDGTTQSAIRLDPRRIGPTLLIASNPGASVADSDQQEAASTIYCDQIIVRPFDANGSLDLPFPVSGSPDARFRREWHKSVLLHVLHHVEKGGLEFTAWKTQLQYLSKSGTAQILARMLGDDEILKLILSRYHPVSYFTAVLEAVEGNALRAKRLLPGGESLNLFCDETSDLLRRRAMSGGARERDKLAKWAVHEEVLTGEVSPQTLTWLTTGVKIYYVREFIRDYARSNRMGLWELAEKRQEWSGEFSRTGSSAPNDYAREKTIQFLSCC